jgi:LD-carboxypeptidase N-terminal domain
VTIRFHQEASASKALWDPQIAGVQHRATRRPPFSATHAEGAAHLFVRRDVTSANQVESVVDRDAFVSDRPLVPPPLKPGDRVRVVSPASTPDRAKVGRGVELLTSWGLVVELGDHVFDRLGHYQAGNDEDRLADINDAFRDPGVRAVISTRGGKGSYRIAAAIDFDAVRRDPKPLVGTVINGA